MAWQDEAQAATTKAAARVMATKAFPTVATAAKVTAAAAAAAAMLVVAT